MLRFGIEELEDIEYTILPLLRFGIEELEDIEYTILPVKAENEATYELTTGIIISNLTQNIRLVVFRSGAPL